MYPVLQKFWKANCGKSPLLLGYICFRRCPVPIPCEMCQEAFKSKHVRELQCGHRLQRGESSLCGAPPRILTVECLEKRKGTFSPRLQSLHLPSKFQACCVHGHHPLTRLCWGRRVDSGPPAHSPRSSPCWVGRALGSLSR